jgi:hypothetical protein
MPSKFNAADGTREPLAVVRPAVDRKGRVFKRERAEHPVTYVLDGFAVAAVNIVVAPYRPELGTEPTEFINKRRHLRHGPGPP